MFLVTSMAAAPAISVFAGRIVHAGLRKINKRNSRKDAKAQRKQPFASLRLCVFARISFSTRTVVNLNLIRMRVYPW